MRALIGATAVIGLVAVVAGCDDDSITAQCVQEDGHYWWGDHPTVVRDDDCTNHVADDNGFFVWGGHQYRYYYGSRGSMGSRPVGGSLAYPGDEDENGYAPSVRTGSGKSIARGGLGGAGGRASAGG